MIFIKENNYCCENYYKALSSYMVPLGYRTLRSQRVSGILTSFSKYIYFCSISPT